MLFSEENRFIYKLYSDVLLENPDTLTIGDDYYSYDNYKKPCYRHTHT